MASDNPASTRNFRRWMAFILASLTLCVPSLLNLALARQPLELGLLAAWIALLILCTTVWQSVTLTDRLYSALGRVSQSQRERTIVTAVIIAIYFLIALSLRDLWREQPLPLALLAQVGLVLAGAFLLYPFLTTSETQTTSSHNKLSAPMLILIAGFFVLFGFFLWGPNLYSYWTLEDDHEIITMLGPDKSLSMSEMQTALSDDVLQPLFVSSRYLPVFWLLRILEIKAWGATPFMYHWARLCMFILLAVTLWRVFAFWVGMGLSFLFTLATFAFVYWVEIFSRLGVSETFAAPFLALYILAFTDIVRRGSRATFRQQVRNWSVFAVAGILCIGSKENFVLLIVPTVLLFAYLLWKRQLTRLGAVALALTLGWALLVIGSLYFGLQLQGTTAYGESVGIVERLRALAQGADTLLQNPALRLVLTGVVVLLLIGSLYVWRTGDTPKWHAWRRDVFKFILILVALAALVLSQLALYDGNWPAASRYDFPGMLVVPLFLLSVYWLGSRLLTLLSPRTGAARFFQAWLAMALLLTLVQNSYQEVRNQARATLEQTLLLQSQVKQISATLHDAPNAPIVMESFSGWDYEAIGALQIYLQAAGVRNPFFLRFHSYTTYDSRYPQEALLAKQLTAWTDGSVTTALYQRIAALPSGACYRLDFSGDGAMPCHLITRIR